MSENVEYISGVLQVTREQLNRAMGVAAELESALMLERTKVQTLQAELDALKATPAKKDAKE
jgi:hypothetical protein